jgi:dihydroorotate dehydrogenase (fumarate)
MPAAGSPPLFEIHPPLLNSACPWATTLDDLRRLYQCPSTGAVTTRTSLIKGFDHDPAKHQFFFFDAARGGAGDPSASSPTLNASINSLGYSPLTLHEYINFLKTISDELPPSEPARKGFIVSVTGSPDDVAKSYRLLAAAAPSLRFPLAMEINLSCPNIPGRPPPAYDQHALETYLTPLRRAVIDVHVLPDHTPIPVGLKTPPYTYTTQFLALVDALESATKASLESNEGEGGGCPVSFVTTTNTLGNCLLYASSSDSDSSAGVLAPALPSNGLGGMAGPPLHPLALGNVATLRRLLDEREKVLGTRVAIIGVGGVSDAEGYRRMRAAGADAVALATGLGLKGVEVFGEVERGLGGRW